MRTETGKAVKLSDYRAPDYLVEQVDLDFKLHNTETQVTARLRIIPNSAGRTGAALQFDGDELNVVSVEIDGKALDASSAAITPDGLTIFSPPQHAFTLTTRTIVNPSANTQLSGLYRSGSAYCTQCEAEGFRRITYFPDRPDVLSVYTTRIEADHAEAEVLLGNGNALASGELGNGRHFAIWHDPHPKPSYLFALVGGNLGMIADQFVTKSGRAVKLGIYLEHGKEERAHYAMDALKRSMKWDEDVFGREYDLDVFNIVAVSDFNMGAMENKGLNVFNDKYVLASPETATDGDFTGIETVIAHEYFHNWTGNRITCRDWFQLCLKEGLTVYRDQEFSADQRSRPVKRIQDVRGLRAAQFAEDAGPLAHNVRPEVYHEINNFYTATVYQKGAEVIRTLKNYIGADAFRRGMDLYFERYDGTAAIVEDFIGCFAESSGRDLSTFMRWYTQAGTPTIEVQSVFDEHQKTLKLTFIQTIPATPGQESKLPHVLPIKLGLISHDGQELSLTTPGAQEANGAAASEIKDSTFILETPRRTIEFRNISSRPAVSVLREFSAPTRIEMKAPDEDYLALAAHDTDMFNRWQALQTYATQLLIADTAILRRNEALSHSHGVCDAIGNVMAGWQRDPEFAAQAVSLPGDGDIAREIGADVDPDAIFRAGRFLREDIGRTHIDAFARAYETVSKPARWAADSSSAGLRSMRGSSLGYLTLANKELGASLALKQFRDADNMTDRMSAISILCSRDCPERETALSEFYDRYHEDHLIMDKWFALQAMIPESGTLARVRGLMEHRLFSRSNPNRFRSLVATFASRNATQFNAADGAGYQFIAEMVLELDASNPQLAARLLVAFRSWRTLEAGRRALAEKSLRRIADTANLSSDVRDIVSRSLA